MRCRKLFCGLLVALAILGLCGLSYADSEKVQFPDNGHFYQRIDSPLPWDGATYKCESLGGYLATITSSNENGFVLNELVYLQAQDDIWLGGTDKKKEGDWKWVTGEAWDYTNWWAGYPDNSHPGENYLAMGATNGLWYDWGPPRNFSAAYPFVCEFENKCPVITSLTATPISGPAPLKVTFTCSAKDPDGKIVKYLWDVNDDNVTDKKTNKNTLAYPYTKDGVYYAKVKVLDDMDCNATSETIEIRVGDDPDLIGRVQKYEFAKGGGQIHMEFEVSNVGILPAGPLTVSFYLSTNGTTPAKTPFKEFPLDGLGGGKSQTLTFDQTFSTAIYGKYILVYVDAGKAVDELNETNNITSIVIQQLKKKIP